MLSESPARVVLDLGGVTFCDSQGLGTLVVLSRKASLAHSCLVLTNVGDFLLFDTVLPPAIRTLTWLIAARELDCNYAWHASVGAARDAKVDASVIDALENCKPLRGIQYTQRRLQ